MAPFAARFNEVLKAKGISRRELARLSGVHVNTLNNWAAGRVPNPHPDPLQRVAEVLAVPYEWLRLGQASRVAEPMDPDGGYRKNDGTPFDPALMQQVVRLVEDQCRLFRRDLDEASRVALMERAYQLCREAGLSGDEAISLTRFLELSKEL
jgi:transcriptional regulator with XRE-family HTH domain